jgi:hypothetical protein
MLRKRPSGISCLHVCWFSSILFLSAALASAQQSLVPSSHVRVIRVIAGAKGEVRNGAFVMTEQRSTFYANEDREIIVYFEWEGSRGIHHCEGAVHGPNGEFASMSSFDYTATQSRFIGFWKVPLSEGSPQGSWTFEGKVDGQPAGQISFQVVSSAKPAGVAAATVPGPPPLPTPASIYADSTAAAVNVDSVDINGRVIFRSSGFALQNGTILTSFRSIDGANLVRIHLPTGTAIALPAIFAWDRHQDWVVLATNLNTSSKLKLAEPGSWTIGDHCYWLNVRPDGTRVFADGQIVGLPTTAWGDRIDTSDGYSTPAAGGPLLNDRGEVIGILGGALPESLVGYMMQAPSESVVTFSVGGGIAVPATVLPQTLPASAVPLQELWSKELMTPTLTGSKYVVYGMLTQGSGKDSKALPTDRELKLQFQRADRLANVLILFSNAESFKSTALIKVYDTDNHVRVSSKPETITVNRGERAERVWQVPLANLPLGVYRVDVELKEGVAWRQYFKLTD